MKRELLTTNASTYDLCVDAFGPCSLCLPGRRASFVRPRKRRAALFYASLHRQEVWSALSFSAEKPASRIGALRFGQPGVAVSAVRLDRDAEKVLLVHNYGSDEVSALELASKGAHSLCMAPHRKNTSPQRRNQSLKGPPETQ